MLSHAAAEAQMRRRIVVFLVCILTLALTACGAPAVRPTLPPSPTAPPTMPPSPTAPPTLPPSCAEEDGITVCRDVEYSRIESEGEPKPLLLDIYLPTNDAPQPLPLLIYIHGGGWMGGSKDGCPGAQVAHEWGYPMACVDYRLSQDAIFPAQIQDVKAAVRWLRANASTFNFDPDRFGSWGDSAGGHLSALLGTSAGVAELEGDGGNQGVSSALQAVVDCYGPTDFTQVPPAFSEPVSYPIPATLGEQYGSVPWFEYTLATTLLLGGPVAEHPDLAALANPITHIDRDDPPFLIIHGEQDDIVPIGQSDLLATALHEAGVEATFIVDPQRGHSTGDSGREWFGPLMMQWVRDFFDAHLKP